MSYNNAPCKDCKDRYLGCHDKCDRYKEFKSRKTALNEVIRKAKQEESFEIEKHARLRKIANNKK